MGRHQQIVHCTKLPQIKDVLCRLQSGTGRVYRDLITGRLAIRNAAAVSAGTYCRHKQKLCWLLVPIIGTSRNYYSQHIASIFCYIPSVITSRGCFTLNKWSGNSLEKKLICIEVCTFRLNTTYFFFFFFSGGICGGDVKPLYWVLLLSCRSQCHMHHVSSR